MKDTEVALQRCSLEKKFWKYVANLQENERPCWSVISIKLDLSKYNTNIKLDIQAVMLIKSAIWITIYSSRPRTFAIIFAC